MSVSQTITLADNDGVVNITKAITVTSGAVITISEPVPNPSTNLLFALAFTVAKLQSIYITSDQVLTLKTNNSGSPQETITLVADSPLVWIRSQGYFTVPFSGNVTALYVTNASGTDANLNIRCVVDIT